MKENACCPPADKPADGQEKDGRKWTHGLQILPMADPEPHSAGDEPCCGPPPSPRSSPHEKPGYTVCPFVDGFLKTPAGEVPRVKTAAGFYDFLGTLRARSGLSRNDYKVAPGLYAVGKPGSASPVLVTANYKLGFDKLRTRLKHTDAWILVIDTRGINVWCAGGKNLFSASEVAQTVKQSGLHAVVSHRRLVLPQLAANGVAAREVKKACGFEVVWGPVRADDIEAFLANNMKAAAHMRVVTFNTRERLALIPVELYFVRKPTVWIIAATLLLSGIGPGVFSIADAVNRGSMIIAAYLVGIFTGAVLTPAFLPWIPARAFSVKGVIAGFAGILPLLWAFRWHLGWLEAFTLLFVALAVSSYMAMNFTGSTPYTAPSGVEKEMRISMPFQAGAVVSGIVFWVVAAF